MSRSTGIEQNPQDDRLADHPHGEARRIANKKRTGRMIQDSWVEIDRRFLVALVLAVVLSIASAELGLFSQLVHVVQQDSSIVHEGIVGLGWGRWLPWG